MNIGEVKRYDRLVEDDLTGVWFEVPTSRPYYRTGTLDDFHKAWSIWRPRCHLYYVRMDETHLSGGFCDPEVADQYYNNWVRMDRPPLSQFNPNDKSKLNRDGRKRNVKRFIVSGPALAYAQIQAGFHAAKVHQAATGLVKSSRQVHSTLLQ